MQKYITGAVLSKLLRLDGEIFRNMDFMSCILKNRKFGMEKQNLCKVQQMLTNYEL